ncbi:MAG: carboxylesterase family protein [Promethearchaeota archaeon]|jgi:para-nitrobenzyl esterase
MDDYLWVFPKKSKETEALSQNMMDYWISFARNNNPNSKELVHWPRYDMKNRRTIIFDTNIE